MQPGAHEFRILGPLAVLDEQGEALPLGGTKERSFLALLLLNANQVVSIDRLIDAIWGERPPASAATMLHGYASRLRRIVSPAGTLITQRPGYVLEVQPGSTDVDHFAALVERGKALVAEGDLEGGSHELTAGLALWRGPALEDIRYEGAISELTRAVEEQRLGALEDRLDADLALGRDVVGELRELVAAHPDRERAAGLLMLALYRAGRQAEAVAVYDGLRRRLASELGLSPSRELEDLHTAILRRDPSLGEPRRPRLARSRRWRIELVAVAVLTAIVASAASVSIVLATRTSSSGAKPLIAEDERLPFPAVPPDLLGSYRATIPTGQSPQAMTLRASDDPVCKPLLAGHGTCFLIHPTDNELDPGARGQAAYHDGFVVLRYARIPFLPKCEGEIDRYRVTPGGDQFVLARRVLVKGPFDDCSFAAFTRLHVD